MVVGLSWARLNATAIVLNPQALSKKEPERLFFFGGARTCVCAPKFHYTTPKHILSIGILHKIIHKKIPEFCATFWTKMLDFLARWVYYNYRKSETDGSEESE